MARQQPQGRKVRETLLMVGEGDSEVAFLKHLKSLYCSGGAGVQVTVINAHGGAPKNVIAYATKQTKAYSYDAHVALLDTDKPWNDQLKSDARKAKIDMIGSIPCFEGLLLSILGKRPAEQCADCKKAIAQLIDIELTKHESYAKDFSKAVLDAARLKVSELDRLLKALQGN